MTESYGTGCNQTAMGESRSALARMLKSSMHHPEIAAMENLPDESLAELAEKAYADAFKVESGEEDEM